jgi:hypothetical protein
MHECERRGTLQRWKKSATISLTTKDAELRITGGKSGAELRVRIGSDSSLANQYNCKSTTVQMTSLPSYTYKFFSVHLECCPSETFGEQVTGDLTRREVLEVDDSRLYHFS